jgi:hypothetical protein
MLFGLLSGASCTDDPEITTLGSHTSTKLPPDISSCVDQVDCDDHVTIRLCPVSQPDCHPSSSTTLEPTIDGAPFSRGTIYVLIEKPGSTDPTDPISGDEPELATSVIHPLGLSQETMQVNQQFIRADVLRVNNNQLLLSIDMFRMKRVVIESDFTDAVVSSHGVFDTDLPINWGGVTEIAYISSNAHSTLGETNLYMHEDDWGLDAQEVQFLAEDAVAVVAPITHLDTSLPKARFELYAYPLHLRTSNAAGYYRPFDNKVGADYSTAVLGFEDPDPAKHLETLRRELLALIVHEYAHQAQHQGPYEGKILNREQRSCLSEGLAEAVAWIGLDRDKRPYFPADSTCQDEIGTHRKGMCILNTLDEHELLTAEVLGELYDPQRQYPTQSFCNFLSTETGNTYVVYLSEALNMDAAPLVTEMGLPHAGSYLSAASALGLSPADDISPFVDPVAACASYDNATCAALPNTHRCAYYANAGMCLPRGVSRDSGTDWVALVGECASIDSIGECTGRCAYYACADRCLPHGNYFPEGFEAIREVCGAP